MDDLITRTTGIRVRELDSRLRYLLVNDICMFSILNDIRELCIERSLTIQMRRLVAEWRNYEEMICEYDGGPHVFHRQCMRDEIDARIIIDQGFLRDSNPCQWIQSPLC